MARFEFGHDLAHVLETGCAQFSLDRQDRGGGRRLVQLRGKEVVATLVGNQDQSFPSFTGSLQAAGQKGTRYELVKARVARAEARLKFDSTSTEAVVAQATNFLERLEDADITITVSRFANQTNRTVSEGKRPKSMSNSRLLRLDSLPPESSNQKNSLGWAYRY